MHFICREMTAGDFSILAQCAMHMQKKKEE